MSFKQITYLLHQNWCLYARLNLTLGESKKLRIPRICFIIPVLLYLGYFAYSVDGLVTHWLLFIWSLLILEIVKVFNKGYFDLIHFFYLDASYKDKIRSMILMELLGIKLLPFLLFGIISLTGSSTLVSFSILLFLYCLFNIFFIFILVIGNRLRVTSIIYQWALIMIFSFLFGFSGLSPTNSEVVFDMHLIFQDWINANLVFVLPILALSLVGAYYVGSLVTKQVYEQKPFINPASFPKKMI